MALQEDLSLVLFVLSIPMTAGMSQLFLKADEPGLAAVVPFYRVTGRVPRGSDSSSCPLSSFRCWGTVTPSTNWTRPAVPRSRSDRA